MTTATYRSLPVEIEISDPIDRDNREAILAWIEAGNYGAISLPDGPVAAMVVYTDSGHHDAQWGDRIAKGTLGEFYVMKPAVFDAKYEPA